MVGVIVEKFKPFSWNTRYTRWHESRGWSSERDVSSCGGDEHCNLNSLLHTSQGKEGLAVFLCICTHRTSSSGSLSSMPSGCDTILDLFWSSLPVPPATYWDEREMPAEQTRPWMPSTLFERHETSVVNYGSFSLELVGYLLHSQNSEMFWI